MTERIEITMRDGQVAEIWLWKQKRGGGGEGKPIYMAPPRGKKESKPTAREAE